MPALSLGSFDLLRLINQVGLQRVLEIVNELKAAFEATDLKARVHHTLNALGLCADFTDTEVDNKLVEMAHSIEHSPAFDQLLELIKLFRSGEAFAAGAEGAAAPEALVVEPTAGIDPAMLFQLAMLIWNIWKSWRN